MFKMLLVAIYFGLLTFTTCTTVPSRPSTNSLGYYKEFGCSRSDTSFYCEYVPRNLSINVTNFYLKKVKRGAIISSTIFDGDNWKNLKVLHIDNCLIIRNNAMKNLESLEELHIYAGFSLHLYNDSFAGLESLKVLRLSRGNRQLTVMLKVAIASKSILTNLEVLSIQKTSFYLNKEKSIQIIMNKPSKSFDMNFVTTAEFGFIQSLWSPECPERINISYSTFNNDFAFGKNYILLRESFNQTYTNIGFSFIVSSGKVRLSMRSKPSIQFVNRLEARRITDLKVFDASYISSPLVNAYVQFLLKVKNKTITLPLEIVTLVSRAEKFNISDINRLHSTIKLQTLSVNIVQYFSRQSPTRELVVKNNHLHYLDVTFHCKNESNLERLDLSSNVIEFIQPNMCSCCTRLTEINLSQNKLFKMADKNYPLFELLISSYQNLKHVQLSFNKLTQIPTKNFHENMQLEQIDLSNNVLTKITFNLGHILNLKSLNLKSNRILLFDRTSLNNLQLINAPSFPSNKHFGILMMDNNPILCSECKCLPFITWLATTPLIDRNGNNIFCKNHEELYIHADENAVQKLQEECDKPKWIRNVIKLSSVIPIETTALMIISICTCLRWRRQRFRRRNIEEKIELIRLNRLNTRFVVFLSYSSEDTAFLNKYAYYPLKVHLQEKLQTERDIICLGDRHFQLGKPINDEMVRSLQQSAVVLLLLSQY